MDLEKPSPRYRRANEKVCWDINAQQRRIVLLVSPEDPNSCSEKPCQHQRLAMKKFPSSNGVSMPRCSGKRSG